MNTIKYTYETNGKKKKKSATSKSGKIANPQDAQLHGIHPACIQTLTHSNYILVNARNQITNQIRGPNLSKKNRWLGLLQVSCIAMT